MRNAIALLVTLFFLMAIIVSIGIGLKYINGAKSTIEDENFLLQTNIILEDVLTYLKNSQELKTIKDDNTGDAFDIFLAQSEFIPFEVSGIKVGISIQSARKKINLNTLLKSSEQIEKFKNLLSSYSVNQSYIDILKDATSQDNNNLTSSFIDEKPQIFRDYIASYDHLNEINEFYTKTYYDNSLSKIDFKDLFYIAKANKQSYCIDKNYATDWTKHMLEDIALEDAEDFFVDVNQSNFPSMYCTSNDNRYIIDVNLEITQGSKTANISFEYNIKQPKGYNFSYEI